MTIAQLIVEKLKGASADEAKQVLAYLEALEAARLAKQPNPAIPRGTWDDVIGRLSGSAVLGGDPVDLQRRLRAEWSDASTL